MKDALKQAAKVALEPTDNRHYSKKGDKIWLAYSLIILVPLVAFLTIRFLSPVWLLLTLPATVTFVVLDNYISDHLRWKYIFKRFYKK